MKTAARVVSEGLIIATGSPGAGASITIGNYAGGSMKKVIILSLIFIACAALYAQKVLDYREYEKARIEMSVQICHFDRTDTLSISPDSRFVATGSNDSTLRIWNRDGVLLRIIKAHTEPINSVRFFHNDTRIATISKDNTLKIWKLNGELVRTIHSPGGKIRRHEHGYQ
jgi:WD40 repeat protein